jgi:serine/threonine-protein kinase
MSILGELKRRKVVQVAAVYAVVAWLLVQIVTAIEEPLALPGWVDTFIIVCLGIGFPIAIILSWAFDVTPEGIKVTGKAEPGAPASPPAAPAITYVMQGLVLLAVSFLLIDQYVLNEARRSPGADESGSTGVTRFNIDIPLGDLDSQWLRGLILTISPDGRQIVFSKPDGLFVREMTELEPRLIVDSGGLNFIMPSPDGQAVAYWDNAARQIKRVATSGGAPAVIGGIDVRSPYGASWGADETILLAAPDGIYRVPANGEATPELVVATAAGKQAYGPTLLPDGDSILFSVANLGDWDGGEIVIESISTHDRKVLLVGGSNARYLPTGHLIYALDRQLFAVPFDLDSLSASGEAIPVIDGVLRGDRVWQTGVAQFDISSNGTLVYVSAQRNRLRSLVWVDRNGQEEQTEAEPGDFASPRISPQQTHVLLRQAYPENTILVWDIENESMTHLTLGQNGGDSALWMPDGERIVYHPGTGPIIDWRTSNNIGDPERLVTGGAGALDPFHPEAISPSGANLFFGGRATPATQWDIGMIALDGRSEVQWLVRGPAFEANPEISPDGRWLVYESNESGRDEIYVRPFPNVDDGRWQISNRGGSNPRWSPGGDELFYIEPGQADRMMAVDVDMSVSEFSFGDRKTILDWPYATGSSRNYDVSKDGQRFLAFKSLIDEEVTPQIVVIQNWFDELKRQVPTD